MKTRKQNQPNTPSILLDFVEACSTLYQEATKKAPLVGQHVLDPAAVENHMTKVIDCETSVTTFVHKYAASDLVNNPVVADKMQTVFAMMVTGPTATFEVLTLRQMVNKLLKQMTPEQIKAAMEVK